MHPFIVALAALWGAPVGIPIWLGLGVLWAARLIRFERWHGPVAEFSVVYGREWWMRHWESWSGVSLPFAMIVDRYDQSPDTVRRHELHHVRRQWLPLGPLFLPVYLVLLAVHGYRDHPFEVAARRASYGVVS
jgi:hypothetical protein